ncbi:MAG: ThiF family adenylyltransferase [Candidatus Aenigmarchaeota archaeon]|nr:ThiF family adenylyltransferase [Candidatus Aenigmarchaeota archaeon]
MTIEKEKIVGLDAGGKSEAIIINYSSDFSKRLKGIVDDSALQKEVVTIIGLGSGGSYFAEYLLRFGVINLNLVDFDIIEVSNICRASYSIFDIGLKKTDALKRKLLKINPYANIKTYHENWLNMKSSERREIVDASSLIVEATDNHRSKILTNSICREKLPAIYPGVYDEGKGGDIIFTIPGVTPCYECIFSSIEDQMEKNSAGWDYTTGKPISMPALCVDINVITCRAVKLALAILTYDEKEENPLFDRVTEHGCNMLFIGNEKFYIFEKPFQSVWGQTEINPACTCQTLR